MLEFLILFSHQFGLDVIANATQNLISGQTTIPTDQLINQVDTNGSLAATGTVGSVITAGVLTAKHFLIDRKTDSDLASTGSVVDKMLFNEIIDNLRLAKEKAEIEKLIQTLATDNPTLTLVQIYDTIIDKTTKETIGMKLGKANNAIIDAYSTYYGAPLNSGEINNYTNNPKKILNETLALVKDKTGN